MTDHAVRAITTDGAFRIITVDATDTAAAINRVQDTRADLEPYVGELVCGALLIRETMSPDFRVQTAVRRKAGGNLFVDAHPGGMTRGLVAFPDERLVLGDDVLLQVTRVLKSGELHQGVIATRESVGLSASLTTYMRDSEQVNSDIEVGSVGSNGKSLTGGFIVQLLPGAPEDALRTMTRHLEALPPVDELLAESSADPSQMLDAVLGDFSGRILEDDIAIEFGCNCSEERILRALTTIGRSELEDIVAEDEPLDIDCDYCGKSYEISPERVAELL